MPVTALIVFDQGGPGPAGQAFEGTVAGGAVTVTNDDNTDVASWRITLADVPPDSGVATGVLASANNNTPTANFTPDVPGSYRIVLEVFDAAGFTGDEDTDIRDFGIRNARGFIIPPYQKLPDPLPVLGSGEPGEKPDEQNYGGQARGWTGDRTDGQLEEFFLIYDDLPFESITSTPFTAAVTGEAPLYLVDLTVIGGSAVFNLPSGARVGQRFRIAAIGGSPLDTVTVTPPGGHNIDGRSSVAMFAGGSGVFIYRGGVRWAMLGAKYDAYERTIVGGVEDTDQTGFVAIGTTVIDTGDFINIDTVTWEAVLETTDGGDPAEIRLFNVTTASVVAGSILSTTSLTPVLVSSTITLASGQNLYEAQLRLTTTGAPNRATCKQAQVVIDWLQP